MSVSAILAIRLVCADPARLADFYVGLGFTAEEPGPISRREATVLGLGGGGQRRPLRLGDQRLDLDCFDDPGAAYPREVDGHDTRFQHAAIVTDDIEAAWRRAETLGATSISAGGPVTLPKSSGGVTAIKFRDPEGHPLEFLQSQKGSADRAGSGQVGIDHSAISVADGNASRRFYERLGLSVRGQTLNYGVAQAELDGLRDAKVDVVPMMPRGGTPHLELLAYRTPSARPASPCAVNDVAATRIVWAADRTALLRDPDGHLHHLISLEG